MPGILNENKVPPGGILVVLKPLLIWITLLAAVMTQDGDEGNVVEKSEHELYE